MTKDKGCGLIIASGIAAFIFMLLLWVSISNPNKVEPPGVTIAMVLSIVFVPIIVVIIACIFLGRKKEETYTVPSLYRPGSFRGAPGSPGTSPEIVGEHNRNCECDFCVKQNSLQHKDEKGVCE